jgi:hypothetical protein
MNGATTPELVSAIARCSPLSPLRRHHHISRQGMPDHAQQYLNPALAVAICNYPHGCLFRQKSLNRSGARNKRGESSIFAVFRAKMPDLATYRK